MSVPRRRSITTRTLLHVVGAVTLVLATTTAVAYYSVLGAMEKEGLSSLSDYAAERAKRESQVFLSAEKNLEMMRMKFIERWTTPNDLSAEEWFHARIARTADGAMRSRRERTVIGRDPTAWVKAGTTLTPELTRMMMISGQLCATYFPAWSGDLQALYVSSPLDFNIGIAPSEPEWVWQIDAEFDQNSFEWARIANPPANPRRLPVWSGVVPALAGIDPAPAYVTLSTPLDLEGKHLVTFHHDLALGNLINNTAQSERQGVEHVIFREDGRAIATPKVSRALMAEGLYQLQSSADASLRRVYQISRGQGGGPWTGYDKESDHYIALSKLEGPDWIFASLLPGPEMRHQAFRSARWVLWAGLGSLAIVLPTLSLILRRNISRPLGEFMEITRRVAAGDSDARVEWESGDELGQLATSFNRMAVAVSERDMTLQRLNLDLEQRIADRTRGLRQSEERFSKAFHGNHALLAILNAANGVFLDANQAFLRTFGHIRAEVIGSDQDALQLWADRTSGIQETAGTEALANTRDGRERLISYSGERINIGSMSCILMMGTDITERKRAETEILRALEREKELNQLKDNFVAMISHEFRTPLEIITTSTDILQRYFERISAEQREKQLGTIQNAVSRMSMMMEEVLLLGRAEAGRLKCTPQDLHLTAWCKRLVSEIAHTSSVEREVELGMHIEDPMVMADESLLRHIFTNLLSNALKYSPAESTVTFAAEREGNTIAFRIIDRGVGIPAADQPYLFDGFHRGSNVGQRPGTGLGLVIVKRCIELHGGTISIDSREGAGTTVTVLLPLC